MNKTRYAALTLALLTAALHAQTPRDFAIDLRADVSTNVPRITLNWSIRRSGNIKYQKIHRRLKGQTTWSFLSDLTTAQTSYPDSTATNGVEYEYWMERYYTNISPSTAMGYLSAGVNVPMAESRGILLLIIDSTMVTPLAPEIEQLKADLTGDGWNVQTITALRSDTAANVQAQIKAAYNADPTNLKMVYVLGHVPVPYSGNIAPDGHGNHVGAWPADGYYGDMNGTWTDTSVNNTSASDPRNDNIPGDGKFDQGSLPSPVELMVGRVDFSNMTRAPSSAVSETSLLRRYLRKAHDFRHKQGAYADIPRRSIMRDGFGYFSGENFAIAGWSWMFTGVGTDVDEPPSMQWFSPSYAGSKSYLVGCGTGGGSWDSASTVGNSVDFGLKTSRVVFTTLFGSYFGDWDSANNFMRAPLAGNATGDSLGLTCFWGGRPNRVTHQMGMGETAGYCMMVSHNSAQAGGGGYTPNIYAGVHCGLMGDPALRLHAVEPPRNLSAVSANTQIALAWSASTEPNLLGYLVYRADTAAGPFTRLTLSPQAATTYTDATVTAGLSYTYLVRTLKLENSPGGTYENPSVGAFVTLVANAGGTSAPDNPTSLTVTQNSSTNAWLAWTDNSDNETGFRVERKTNAGGSYASLGTVGTSVTNFTDSGPFTHGNVYFYRVIATGSPEDSVPSQEDSFEAFAGFFNLPENRIKVSKTAGSATVTVTRFGGVTGPASVTFATSDTSAFAGTHYVATNGTLMWADGDTAPKTVTVPLINTAAPQSARQFKVTLSAPSTGTTLSINTYAAVLIQDPTATLGAPWSQTIVGGITDSSPAVTESGSISSVTIGGAGLTASATSEAGQFVYKSHTGDGVLTAFFPAGLPADGNARHALMVRASTANNVSMAAAATSSSTSFGTRLFSRSSAGSSSSLTPSAANTLVFARWLRLIRSGNVYSAETSSDGNDWLAISSASFTNIPATAVWGFFHTSSDWSVTALGNYHLAQVQNMTLTDLPPPTVPSGLTATLASSTSISLRWDNASFASGYRVERKTESGDFTPIVSLPSAASTNQAYVDAGLAVNTAYAYRVVATNAVGESAPSAPAYAATAADMFISVSVDDADGADATVRRDLPETPLGTQTNLSVAYYDPYTWETAAIAKTYLRFNLAGIGGVSSATLKLSLLGVTGYDSIGYAAMSVGALSESSDVWTESGITWSNAPQNSVSGSGFLSPLTSLGSFYSFADDLTPPGTVIPFALSAANLNSSIGANGLITLGVYQSYSANFDWASREHPNLPPPTLELIVTTNTPSRAAFLTASPGTGWSIDLSWQDTSASETGFLLERREGAGAFSELQTFGANATGFHDGTTQPGVTYTYRVRSFNANGPSDWSLEVTLTSATVETAMSAVWDGGGVDTLFTTVTNWDFNTLPPSDGTATLTFGTGGSLATLNASTALRGLVLNRDADFTLADGGGTLTLSEGGISVLLPTASSRAYALASDIVIASNQTWSVTNNGAGVATVTVSGSMSDGGSGASLSKSGNGVLVLTGDNSYSGVTTVRTGGVLRISHSQALGNTTGATVVENGGWLELSGGITVAEPISLTGDTALGYAGTLRATAGSNVWSGPLYLNGARVRVNSGSLDVTGGCTGPGGVMGANGGCWLRVIDQPVLFGAGTFYAHGGGGTLALAVSGNTWGIMDLASAIVRTDVPNALPPACVLQMNTGTTLDLNGNDQTVAQLKNANTTVGSRLVTSEAPATLTINQSATTYYNGLLTGALSLVKTGNGMLTLSNALNTLSGSITIQQGTLTVAPTSRLGSSTNIAVSGGTLALQSAVALTNAAHLSIADGGTVSLAAGVVQPVDRLYLAGVRKGRGTWGSSASGATYTDDAHFAGNGVLMVLGGESTVWDAGGADFAFSNPDNWDFDVEPFLDGTATLTFGTGGGESSLDIPASLRGLRFDRDADFTVSAGGGAFTLGAGGFSAQASGTVSRAYTVAAPVTLASDQNWGITNSGAGVTVLTVSGPVTDGASSFGITKSGNGLLTLAGNNAYDGPTSVGAGGGLLVAHGNGLGSASGGTDVAVGGWLEVSGHVTVPEPLTLRDASALGALRSTGGTNVWSGPVTLEAATRLRALPGSALTLAGGISGSSDLYLSPDEGGELAVSGLPLALPSRKLYAYGSGVVTIGPGAHSFGTLEVSGVGLRVRMGAANVLPASCILSLGATYSPQGVVDLNGFDQTVARLIRGNTASSANRLVTSDAPATLTVNETSTNPINYNGHLTGALGLTKGASGYLLLYGAYNTYTGATTVNGGTLEVSAGARLGFSERVTVSGGTLKLMNANALADTATLRIAGGKVHLQSGTDTIGALYLGGVRRGPGTYGSSSSSADIKDNTYFDSAGTGVISVPSINPGSVWDGGGTAADTRLNFANNWDTDWPANFDGTASIQFGSGGSLATVNTNAAFLGLLFLSDADFTVADGGGVLTLGAGGVCALATNETPRTYTLAAPVNLAADQNWGITNSGAGVTALTVSGPVTDGASSFGITKSGNGLLTLSGNNAYDGPTSVGAGGGLLVAHGNGLGSASGGTDVAVGGWLEVSGHVTVPEPLTLRDASALGALRSTGGTNVWSGPVTLEAATRLRALPGSALTLSGGISGSSDLYLSPDAGGELAVSGLPLALPSRKIYAYGSGVVTIGPGAHAFGTLEVSGVGLRVRMGAANVLPASCILSLGATYSPQGMVDLNGFDQTVARLIRGNTVSSSNRLVTSDAPATLTVNETSTNPINYNGQLTGALGLTKGASGYLLLYGAYNTYTGATTVNGGTLEVSAGSRLGFSERVTVSGGTLKLMNANALADTATLRITGGKVHLQTGTDTVNTLYLNGKQQRRGTYGSSSSSATYKSDTFFSSSGSGTIQVLHGPESILLVK
jgi:autotransporter-associated beta strand protein